MQISIDPKKGGSLKKLNPVGTAQGRNTLVSLLICAILGMVLSRVLPFIIQQVWPNMKADAAEEIGVLAALGISGVVLVIRLLRPGKSVSPLRRQLELLKEQEKSDGK